MRFIINPRIHFWLAGLCLFVSLGSAAVRAENATVPVTVGNFVRAETDAYFRKTVEDGAFGKLTHHREMAAIDKQDVVRMNRDTLYSSGVFDLEASPATITLPDTGNRFMSMQILSEDHYTTEVAYAPGRLTLTKDKVGTRYVFVVVRTLADPRSAADIATAHALQDAITVEQSAPGKFEIPKWDPETQSAVRDALSVLGGLRGGDKAEMFGTKEAVDPVAHLIGTAVGWGGNPGSAAIYQGVYPGENDGKTPFSLTVKDVPVDGFWSISLYNAKGYFQKNALDAYSINNLTAKPNADGSFTIQFGGCREDTPNCLPTTPGWNYTIRLYRPQKALLDGSWIFPKAEPMK